jgi:hypothetical protein
MFTTKWYLRIFFIVFPISLAQLITYSDLRLFAISVIIGAAITSMSYHVLELDEKFDTWVKWISFGVIVLFIAMYAIKVDSETIVYKNSDYRTQQGWVSNDSTPSTLMIYIDDTSKIITNYSSPYFSSGKWFLDVGQPADTNKFHIEVKITNYVVGYTKHVYFIYNDKCIDNEATKLKIIK